VIVRTDRIVGDGPRRRRVSPPATRAGAAGA
jgi:hypothetical protein